MGIKKIIEAIYEPKFLEYMYGFRTNRGCHDALKAISRNIENGKVSYVVDADIKGFFDHVDHKWLIKCVEQHIKDTRIIRMIKRFLKAGIIENMQKNRNSRRNTTRLYIKSCVSKYLYALCISNMV